MPLTPGTMLGAYEILAPLGAGGMGEVYRALDRKLDRHVAIKVIAEPLSGDPQAAARFAKEAKLVAALSHPNILAIHDYGSQDGVEYAVSELLEGLTLRQRMSSHTLDWREAVSIAAAVADGLGAAHANGIVHRDLKPENIFLASDGQVKILDFGLARRTGTGILDPATDTETKSVADSVAGTLEYMSPEQLRGQGVTTASDLFSFGCVLYEMITGKRPFSHAAGGETVAAILRDEPAPYETGKHPRELDRLIARCLEKEPGARWRSARDLSSALKGLQAGSDSGTLKPAVMAVPKRLPWAWLAAAIAGLLVLVIGLALVRNRESGSGAIRSIAVLPLRNLSGDAEQEYFADGMTESLISNLAQIRALKVISRASVMSYKRTSKRLPEIARELSVDAIVDGSVQRAGGRVRIMAQLIRASDDVNLWANEYQGDLADVLRLESEVARAVASEIRVQLTPVERSRLAAVRTVNPAAHEAYLLGKHHQWRLQERDLKEAIEQFERAIQIDPGFAEAYAGLAATIAERGVWGQGAYRAGEAKAKAAARKAIELNPNLADAHGALGFLEYHYDWSWDAAERSFKRALEIDPNHRQAHTHYAVMLMALGRFPEAISQIAAAREVDPVSSYVESSYGRILYRARRYEEALGHFQRAVQLDPNDYTVYPRLIDVYTQIGKYQEAIATAEKAHKLADGPTFHLMRLAQIYAHMGKRQEAIEAFDGAKANPNWGRQIFDIALTYAALGDKDQAFKWLERGVEQRELVIFINTEPKCDSLRGDPRFQRLIERIGLR